MRVVVVFLLLVTGVKQSQLLGLRLSLEFDKNLGPCQWVPNVLFFNDIGAAEMFLTFLTWIYTIYIPVAFCSLVAGGWVGAAVAGAGVVPVEQHGGEGVTIGPMSNPNLGEGSSASPA